MPKVKLRDDFYPGLSIHEKLRQTPQSVLNRFSDLLKAKSFSTTDANLRLILNASRQLYVLVVEEGGKELTEFELETKHEGKPIRGGFFPPFELVFRLLSEMLDYIRNHPLESLNAAADFAVLADYVEGKLGPAAGILAKKFSRKSIALKQLLKLSKKRGTTRNQRKQAKLRSRRKSTASYIR